jgi:prepilin peptidase CpaA
MSREACNSRAHAQSFSLIPASVTFLIACQFVGIALALACLVAAVVRDVTRFEIPDLVSGILLASAFLYGWGHPDFGWTAHLTAPVLVTLVGSIVFARGWMGGGDIKMLAATSAWTGFSGLPLQLALVAVAGGVLAVFLLLLRKIAWHNPEGGIGPRLLAATGPLPYAVAISTGSVIWAWQAYPLI